MTPIRHRLLAAVPAVVAVVTLPLAALAGLSFGGEAAAVVAIVGWFLLTPLSAILNDEVLELTDDGDPTHAAPAGRQGDPVEHLRERYAHGEIDEVEFERRLDVLLETEDADPETARERIREGHCRND